MDDRNYLMTSVVRTLAEKLVALRRAPAPIQDAVAIASVSESEAYAVQAEVVRMMDEKVGGWKVAVGPGGRPFAAPLLLSTILPSPTKLRIVPNVTMIETEMAFKLACDIPLRRLPYSRPDILAAVSTISAAFEIIGPRVAEGAAVPFTQFLADNLGNAYTIVTRAGIDPGGIAFDQVRGRLDFDGDPIASGPHPAGDPIVPLLLYANAPSDCLGGLRRGQIVITGSFTKVTPVKQTGLFSGLIDGIDPVLAEFAT